MELNVVKESDFDFLMIDRLSIGIGFSVSQFKETKIVTFKDDEDLKSNSSLHDDEVERLFMEEMKDTVQITNEENSGSGKLLPSSFKIESHRFRTYVTDKNETVVYHYFPLNGYRIAREILINSYGVNGAELDTFRAFYPKNKSSTKKNFIPTEIRSTLGSGKIKRIRIEVFDKILVETLARMTEVEQLLKQEYPKLTFEFRGYFKLSNIEIAMDIESHPGICFGSREEIHSRLIPVLDSSLSGNYIDENANTISPIATTALAQSNNLPAYFWGILEDETEINIYTKYQSHDPFVNWLQRFERKFTTELYGLRGVEKIEAILNKDRTGDDDDKWIYASFKDASTL